MTKEELEFLQKGRELGFNIINHNGVEKIEINLQKPILLTEDFELASEFNHLVYYCLEPFTIEEIKQDLANYENTQLYDFFEDEKVIIGENNV